MAQGAYFKNFMAGLICNRWTLCMGTVIMMLFILISSFKMIDLSSSDLDQRGSKVITRFISQTLQQREQLSKGVEYDVIHGPMRERFTPYTLKDSFTCANGRYDKVQFPMCLYESNDDIYVSKLVRNTGKMYELGHIKLIYCFSGYYFFQGTGGAAFFIFIFEQKNIGGGAFFIYFLFPDFKVCGGAFLFLFFAKKYVRGRFLDHFRGILERFQPKKLCGGAPEIHAGIFLFFFN